MRASNKLTLVQQPVNAWFLLTIVFLEALDIAALAAPLFGAIGKTFVDLDNRALALIFTVNLFANMIATPFGARAADRWNRKNLLVFSLLLTSLGSLLVALSPTWPWLIVGRGLSGLGVGMFLPLVTVLSGWRRNQQEQSTFLGGMGAAFGIAFLFGTPLSAYLASRGQWRIAFLVEAVLAIILSGLVFKIDKRAARPQLDPASPSTGIDAVGLLLFALGTGLIAAAVSLFDLNLGIAGLLLLETGGFFVLGMCSLLAWIRYEKRCKAPFWNPGTNTRQLKRLYVKAGLTGFWESALSFLPLSASLLLGLPKTGLSGLVLTPILLIMGVSSPLVGRFLPAIGWPTMWRLGCISTGFGALLLLLGSLLGTLFWIGLCFFGLGISFLIGAPLRWAIWKQAAASEAATALGMMNTSLNLGQVIGSAMWGAWLGSYQNQIWGPIGAFIAIATSAALFLFLRDDKQTAAVSLSFDQSAH